MAKTPPTTPPAPPEDRPGWYNGKTINEAAFCHAFLAQHRLAYTENAFFTPEGRVTDVTLLKEQIFRMLELYATTSVTKKISNIIELLKITANTDQLLPQTDRIHLANGTLFLDGRFSTAKDEIVRSRLPIQYNPDAAPPEGWLSFLDQLLYPEDIVTLQEFFGYILIPSNKGQRMMVIKGSGGEGKSQIGAVLSRVLGPNAKDGSVGKISENQFARADLEHCLLMIDDDMRMEALKQTNYVKSLVTAQGKMDLEKKGKQSYQGWMYARILAFSNGDLQSLYDRSDGFYRRQLMSERARSNREVVKLDANNVIAFLDSTGYIRFDPGLSISSKELYQVYCVWCEENAWVPIKPRSFSDFLVANQKKYGIEHNNNQTNAAGRRVRGFTGIGAVIHLPMETVDHWQKAWPADNPF